MSDVQKEIDEVKQKQPAKSKIEKPVLGIHKLHENVKTPEYGTDGSSCFDLRVFYDGVGQKVVVYSRTNEKIYKHVQKNQAGELFIHLEPQERMLVPTGIVFDIPDNYEVKIYPRSGVALKRGLGLANSVAVIDSDYIDQTFILLENRAFATASIIHDERIAQAELKRVEQCTFKEVKQPSPKTSRDGGFGSTGTK